MTSRAVDTTWRRELEKLDARKSKFVKGNESNFAFICFQYFFGIGLFQ
jgi:hypothetical protein